MLKLTDGNALAPQRQMIHKIISMISIIVSTCIVILLYYDSYIGLQVIWNVLIPVAPLIFLLVPNLWTAMCPLAIFQSIPKRFGFNRDKYLNKRQTRFLNYIGIGLFFILVPARFFIFNVEGEMSLAILLVLIGSAFIFGIVYTGLSGWCMGLCPIRPVELMYGQFTVEKNRPEVCSTCDQCVSNCSRLYVQNDKETEKYNIPFRFFMYAFPGFIFMYFNINPTDLVFMIYAKMYGASIISFLVFFILNKVIITYKETMLLSTFLSIGLYYYFIIPPVAESWFFPHDLIPVLYIIPLTAIIYGMFKYTDVFKKAKFVLSTVIVVFLCFSSSAFIYVQDEDPNYLNWEDHAKFVGDESCVTCHADIYEEYNHSEMGTSFSVMNESFMDLDISTSHVYDDKQDLHYFIKKVDSIYYVDEYRYDEVKQDTTHYLSVKIDYIVGSGANTKSFIFERNGFFFEMPITWYTNKNKWDLSPGYHNYNQRFFRKTNQACIDCHNQTTEFEKLSEHRFKDVGNGIDCEKCHGPASLHIEYRTGAIDFLFDPIKNPADQDQDYMVCYDCHTKKEFSIHEVDDRVNFTAHATRLSMSKCFTEADLTCITCHDPHNKLQKTVKDFDRACITCHGEENIVKITNHENLEDCTTCHMPRSDSKDIPHVDATDHWIKVHDKTSDKYRRLPSSSYLDYVIPSSISEYEKNRAKEFLNIYTQYIGSATPKLDTLLLAENLIDKQIFLKPHEKYTQALIKYYLKKNIEASRLFEELEHIDPEYFEQDAKYYYFYAKSLLNSNQVNEAIRRLNQALAYYPNYIQALQELSNIYAGQKQFKKALDYVESILTLNPYNEVALYQRGFIYQTEGKFDLAMKAYQDLLTLFPDDHNGNINLAALEFQKDQNKSSVERLVRIYRFYPTSTILVANIVRIYASTKDKVGAEKYFSILKSMKNNERYLQPLQNMIKQI